MNYLYIGFIVIFIIGMAGIPPATAELTTVAEGGMVFVGEEGLTFTSGGASIPAGKSLYFYAPGDTPGVECPSALYYTKGPRQRSD